MSKEWQTDRKVERVLNGLSTLDLFLLYQSQNIIGDNIEAVVAKRDEAQATPSTPAPAKLAKRRGKKNSQRSLAAKKAWEKRRKKKK